MASHRRTLAAALASAAASVSLYPIFTGGLWFLAGLGAIAVVAATGTATRRQRLPELVCLFCGLVALLLYVNLVFANSRSLWHLLPTPASARLLGHLVRQGFTEAGKYAPPVPELTPMVLLAAGGIGIAALLADWMAVRLGSAALAGLPLLLLFTEPFTLSVGRGFLGTTAAFCVGIAGYLALLSSEGKDRIREWESQDPVARNAPDTKALAAAGRRVGFASVAVALVLPLVIPGLHVTRLFGGQVGIGGRGGQGASAGAGGVGFPSDDTQLSQTLSSELDTPSQTVLAYRTAVQTPDYLQIYVLDKLTDSGWSLFSQPESLARVTAALPLPPGLSDLSSASVVNTTVNIAADVGQDNLGALPVPYPTIAIKTDGKVSLEADRSTLMLLDQGSPIGGLSYQVTSLADAPTEQDLNDVGAAPASIRDNYLEVPSAYDSLRSLAESVVSEQKATTPFEKAVALQDWLADGGFAYTLKAPAVLNAAGLAQFLKDKSGYCQQFSFAMGVLARLLGIPSRVAYGFTAGSFVSNGEWLVTTHDAHAWPELFFAGYGWLRFEPTPSGSTGQGTATAPSYTEISSGAPGGSAAQAAPTAPASAAAGSSASQALLHHLGEQLGDEGGPNLGLNGGTISAPAAKAAGGPTPWLVFALVLAGLLILALVAPWVARLLIRRRRWHRRRHLDRPDQADAEWAHAAWRELRDDLADYGASCLPSESPRAVAARAGADLALAEPALEALGRIAMAEERARYAARPTDGSGLRHDSVTVRRAIAAAAAPPTRWRGRLLPASVIGPALNATAQAADIFGRLSPERLSRFRTSAR